MEHIPRWKNFIAEELSKIASRQEPVPPGIFMERLSHPSIEARLNIQGALNKEAKGIPGEEEAPGERPVLATRPARPVCAEDIWKYLHQWDLPDDDKSVECIAQKG